MWEEADWVDEERTAHREWDESFRRGVRYSIKHALEQGLTDDAAVEQLVAQICYRAADLGYLLDVTGQRLSALSEALRDETELGPDTE